jgi:hypothetical protein
MDNIKAEKTFNNAKKSSADYHENLQGVSEDLHPFSLEDNGIVIINSNMIIIV